MHRGLREPHLFNAGPNPLKLIKNLEGLIDEAGLNSIRKEIDRNVVLLFKLGLSHYDFARTIPKHEWRQRISRYYYGAYNVRRAVALKNSGQFSTDSSDHKTVDQIPDEMQNAAALRARLGYLRDDRNLADYSHLAEINDLLVNPAEWELFVHEFIESAREYLKSQNIQL
jgi:hypothetical protein